MKKRIVVIFLLLVFTVQNLPLQQLIQTWANGQFTEELPHDDAPEKAKAKSYFVLGSLFEILPESTKTISGSIIVSNQIPLNHTSEIHVPPPNC
ncbi:MAG: hypothetical protein NTZ19_01130 [Bacteroidetes bacterium]|nr:hypothetical protein [Bacteroidota bacterium]